MGLLTGCKQTAGASPEASESGERGLGSSEVQGAHRTRRGRCHTAVKTVCLCCFYGTDRQRNVAIDSLLDAQGVG